MGADPRPRRSSHNAALLGGASDPRPRWAAAQDLGAGGGVFWTRPREGHACGRCRLTQVLFVLVQPDLWVHVQVDVVVW